MAYLGLSPGRAEGVQDDPHSPPLFEEQALGAFCKRDCAFEDDRLGSSAILEFSNWIEKKAPPGSGAESVHPLGETALSARYPEPTAS